MGTAYLYGNGGSGGGSGGFGLQIVEGLVRPKNPTQGMIWAKTEHKVAYYDLSATRPENPADGTLWVNISDSGKTKIVSPVSKEWITVYPLYAEQYVGGTWADIDIASYQDGEWVDWWNGKLYENGNEYEEYTGGWETFQHHSQTYNTAGCSKDGGKLTLRLTGTKCAVAYGTVEPIDVTDYTSIEFTADEIYTECAFAISTMRSTSSATSRIAQIVPTSAGVHFLDISGLSGKYYVWFGDYTSSGAGYGAVVSKIRFVR